MLESNLVENVEKTKTVMEDVHIIEHASLCEGKINSYAGVQKPKRKVQFSRPLEYWREYDKETGQLSELKDSKIKEKSTQHSKNVEVFDKNRENSSQQNIDCKGGAKTQSITEVIQAFQKRQNKKLNVLKQADEKRKDCITGCKQNVKLSAATSSSLHLKQLNNRKLFCNVANCSKLTTDGGYLVNLHKESSLIQSYCTYSFSTSLSMLTSFKVPPSSPFVCTSRKLYDERLLPNTPQSAARNYYSPKTFGSELPPVAGKLPTPHIVQLFD